MTQPQHYSVLGAYALVARLAPELRQGLYEKLPSLGVDALEIPIGEFVAGAQRTDLSEFSPLDIGLDSVVTCIPTVMQKVGCNKFYGLASVDEAGRSEAVRDIVEVLELSDRLAVSNVRGRLRAIQVHSAPRVHQASVEAFEASLREILAVTPKDVEIVVEHCDAQREGRPFEKGFLELSDELGVAQRIADSRLGVVINWGRSAIEGRTAEYVTEQIESAAAAGALKGIMFSGVAAESGAWGPAWEDSHFAPYGSDASLVASHASLLGPDEYKAALYAAGDLADRSYTGIKITVLDAEQDPERCFAVAQSALRLANL